MLLHRRIRLEAATGKNDAALRPNAPRRAVMSHDRADHALRAAQQPPGRAVRPDRNAACGQVVVQHLEQARAGAKRPDMRINLRHVDAGYLVDHHEAESVLARKGIVARYLAERDRGRSEEKQSEPQSLMR